MCWYIPSIEVCLDSLSLYMMLLMLWCFRREMNLQDQSTLHSPPQQQGPQELRGIEIGHLGHEHAQEHDKVGN